MKRKNKKNYKQFLFVLSLVSVIIIALKFSEASQKDSELPEIPVEIFSESTLKTGSQTSESFDIKSPEPVKSDKYAFIQLPENLELPVCQGFSQGEDHQIRKFQNYTICYRESYEQAEWAAYCLKKSELEKNVSRGNNFHPDPEILSGSASLSDYKKSGYDRGHLAPAADFAFSEEAMSESFFMSNMSPQVPELNRETWQYLEAQVRRWAEQYGKIYVVTGPLLEKSSESYNSIGENKVAVPEFFYKVILAPVIENSQTPETSTACSDIKTIGFILPNEKCSKNFMNYAVTVDEVEKRSGLDFFSLLPDQIENQTEAVLKAETL